MTPYLHGNGSRCQYCDGTGKQDHPRLDLTCNLCRGSGIAARPIKDVIRDTIRDARAAG